MTETERIKKYDEIVKDYKSGKIDEAEFTKRSLTLYMEYCNQFLSIVRTNELPVFLPVLEHCVENFRRDLYKDDDLLGGYDVFKTATCLYCDGRTETISGETEDVVERANAYKDFLTRKSNESPEEFLKMSSKDLKKEFITEDYEEDEEDEEDCEDERDEDLESLYDFLANDDEDEENLMKFSEALSDSAITLTNIFIDIASSLIEEVPEDSEAYNKLEKLLNKLCKKSNEMEYEI